MPSSVQPSISLCDTVTHNPKRVSASTLQDARAVKSGQALRAALLALLERKPFDQITIREITAAAGVHYATFFRHHTTKEALLDHVAADQISRLVELTVPILDAADSHAAVLALCAYVSDHRSLWKSLLTGGAAGTMRDELLRISRDIAADRPRRDDNWLPVELAVTCSVSQIIETLIWWLMQQPDAYTTEQVAAILHRLLASVGAASSIAKVASALEGPSQDA